ncbi:type II secretion system secretin GspD [Thiocapsa bogorovii]|uniref:type II secretion system secretin GspD n=1 Tax=Thiocapsa bogorovii TaxID=521689 RepID=UPI001E374BF9|nr:type II secretion system secretin GspD [Thiocapsa bogorovii]UHD14216.1 type II secretion system secretin GspD [Thiocapsa bogorovii]
MISRNSDFIGLTSRADSNEATLDPKRCRGARQPLRNLQRLAIVLILAIVSSACERAYWDPTVRVDDMGEDGTRALQGGARGASSARGTDATSIALAGDDEPGPTVGALQRGTGTFVREISPPSVDTTPGDVTLNFDGTDIREVVKVILGDLLQVNYVLHPAVQGVTSLQTGRPLRRDHLIPTLETLLRMNNAAIVYSGGTYEVVPLANAVQGRVVPQLGESGRALPEGYSVQVVPLQYIGAEEMSNILQPLAPEGSVIRVDNLRNLVVIAGTSPDMGNLLDTIRVFDVDWMAGLSVGFFSLEYAKANEVVTQLQTLLGDEGSNPLKGVFRFVPVESANAVLVVSPQASYLQQASNWIERLDMAEATGDAAERLFVYRVRHGDAENLADTLSQLFGGEASQRSSSVGGVAPGLSGSSIGSTGDGEADGGGVGGQSAPRRSSSREIELSSPVSIVADATNNSLMVRSSPRDYKKILDALKQLDILPLQVLVEATIVEISLEGNLRYGVQWNLFGLATKDQRSQFTLGSGDSLANSVGLTFPGFNWAVISRPDTIRATLSALAQDNLVNVLSSPSVMVLDNQTAKIQVGKEVPIATSQQQGLTNTDRVVNTIEYRPTGVMLSVKPRVTPGGLVQMEIEQEVSTVDEVGSGGSALDSPTFSTRNITSSVAVRSNQAVVLGGLIQNERSDGNQGVPGLYNLPFAGPLFGQRSKVSRRTELVVVLTPKVVASDQDAETVTRDFRNKVRGLQMKF